MHVYVCVIDLNITHIEDFLALILFQNACYKLGEVTLCIGAISVPLSWLLYTKCAESASIDHQPAWWASVLCFHQHGRQSHVCVIKSIYLAHELYVWCLQMYIKCISVCSLLHSVSVSTGICSCGHMIPPVALGHMGYIYSRVHRVVVNYMTAHRIWSWRQCDLIHR